MIIFKTSAASTPPSITTIHRTVIDGGVEASEVPVFHQGTAFVPQTGPAILERGEAIIPASRNPFNQTNNADNRQFNISLGDQSSQRLGLDQELLITQSLRNIAQFDASL